MINKIKQLLIRYKELIIYVLFGVLTTVVNLLVFAVFNRLLGDERYLITNAVAWLAAVTFSYITSKLWVFESKSWELKVFLKEVTTFFAARVVTLFIEEAGLYILVDLVGFSKYSLNFFGLSIGGALIAKAAIAVVVVVVNYIFSKLVIFKKKK